MKCYQWTPLSGPLFPSMLLLFMKSYQAINSLDFIFRLASPIRWLTLLKDTCIWSDQCVLGVGLIPKNMHQNYGICLKENGLRVQDLLNHINSRQTPNFLATEHGFSNHLRGSTNILNSRIKPILQSQEGKKTKPLGHVYTQIVYLRACLHTNNH